ncbi:MAG: Rhs family protein [Myxococcaceae bacterium]|nr:Rhs family protein [Myxococcaceae bacterium]
MVAPRSSLVFGVVVAAAPVVLGLLAPSCKPSTRFEDRPVVVYSPTSCKLSQADAFSVIYGNGDFENADSAVSSLYLRDVGALMSELPATTRSVIVDVSEPGRSVDWRGTAEVPSAGPINVLVWPGGETCRLTRNVEPRTEVTLGVFGRHLMVAGGKLAGQGTPRTYVGDLSTGIVSDLVFGLGTGRSRSTITAFGETADQEPTPALVAGGEDPETQTALGTGEIYVPKPGAEGDIGDFDRVRIDLSEPRTKHGAVVLASGATLLVGGIGQFGTPLRTMEIVDPKTRRYRTGGVATLAVPRSDPTVLRLASGEILVAGGFNGSNLPVPTIEWFSADASHPSKRTVDLVTGQERAFVPLEAGGALAVVRPATGVTDFNTVWVISADGTLEPALPIDPSTLDRLRLFPGTDGAPVLWTGQRWLRWQPWFGAFQPIADAPTRGPRGTAIASGDRGLALWLDDRAPDPDEDVVLDGQLNVRGYRFDTRSRFGTVRNPLLVDSTAGLAPDRLSGTPGSSIRFVDGKGLELGPGASAFVTDLTFSGVAIDLDNGDAPYVVLRQEDGRELEVGGAACPFSVSASASNLATLHVERNGARVTVAVGDGDASNCIGELDATARVAVGVRGAGGIGTSLAHNLRITRR